MNSKYLKHIKYIKLIFLVAVVAAMAGTILMSNGNLFVKAQEGDTVSIYYVVTSEPEGRFLESNVRLNGHPMRLFFPEYHPQHKSAFYYIYDISGVPIVFVLGEGEVISRPEYSINNDYYKYNFGKIFPELENAVYGMHANEIKNIQLSPEEGYGYYDPQLVVTYNKAEIAGVWGDVIRGGDVCDENLGVGIVTEITPDTIVVDYNSEFADQYLNIEIKLLKIN